MVGLRLYFFERVARHALRCKRSTRGASPVGIFGGLNHGRGRRAGTVEDGNARIPGLAAAGEGQKEESAAE